MASYSASVWPPGTPNTCRTPCSASKLASSAPPCWWCSRSSTRHSEQAGRGAAKHEFLISAEPERTDLIDGMVCAHVERAVRAEQQLSGPGVTNQIGQQLVVVGDGVVVEPAQRRVRAPGDAGAGLGADGEGPAQPAADHRQRTAAVGQQH